MGETNRASLVAGIFFVVAGVAFLFAPMFHPAMAHAGPVRRELRVPTVFIEVYDRVDSPTMTGRLCGPFTTRRIAQWQQQLDFYPDAHLVGPLL